MYIYTYIYIEQHVINTEPIPPFDAIHFSSISSRLVYHRSIRFNDFPFYFSLVHLSMEERKWKCERSQAFFPRLFSFSSFFVSTPHLCKIKSRYFSLRFFGRSKRWNNERWQYFCKEKIRVALDICFTTCCSCSAYRGEVYRVGR